MPDAGDKYPKLPENVEIAEKPKNEWDELIASQNNFHNEEIIPTQEEMDRIL
jgi:hypothetical protein